MGFCIYCNKNVYGSSTCPKCYRTIPVSNNTASKNDGPSRVTAMFPDQKRLNQTNTDKWQDTYSKKAIFNSGINSAAPTRPKQQRNMPQFNAASSQPNKYDLKKCITCQGGNWADYRNNSSVIVCESCKKSGLQSPTPESSSTSTPVLSSMATSKSSLTSSANKSNAYFQFQRTRRASMFNRSNLLEEENQGSIRINGPSPTSTVSTSALARSPMSSPPTSPILDRITNELSAKHNFSYRREREVPSPTASVITPSVSTSVKPIEPKKTESTPRKRKVLKKPCKECGQHVSKKDYRGLKIHTGEVLCYHSHCLFCAKCNQNFNGLDFCTDGKNFYHTECPDATTILKNQYGMALPRRDSPLSEEEDAYPRTPPSHNTHFDVLSSSQESLPYLEDNLLKKKNVIAPDFTNSAAVTCHTCTKPVTDSTCLELANQFYHKECLLCAGCNKTVPTDRKLSKFEDKLYCDHCTPSSKTKSVNGLRINIGDRQIPKRAPTTTTPSDLLKSRKNVLPRLGGVRTCARCNQSMPFSDTQPGPGASRWHKKCLRCTGCKKQMDSDAHMTTNEETGLCLVHCRECLDETPKPRFVR
ncbi:hypothetical protein INT47_007964 [Mucor saturninus]|uniref:LIM zinc-binding domain-containing protein n=1 Tax=Mucor saturninus TaxID=64648 RepID=A0A8H7QN71_9FUNG|nr:hypothetical protein INT47_007964 [Mucor saturninus]